jgi:hypothetical protein
MNHRKTRPGRSPWNTGHVTRCERCTTLHQIAVDCSRLHQFSTPSPFLLSSAARPFPLPDLHSASDGGGSAFPPTAIRGIFFQDAWCYSRFTLLRSLLPFQFFSVSAFSFSPRDPHSAQHFKGFQTCSKQNLADHLDRQSTLRFPVFRRFSALRFLALRFLLHNQRRPEIMRTQARWPASQ